MGRGRWGGEGGERFGLAYGRSEGNTRPLSLPQTGARRYAVLMLTPLLFACAALQPAEPAAAPQPAVAAKPEPPSADAIRKEGIAWMLSIQQSDPSAKSPESPGPEWPYEGVYRVNGQIPVGYRIGGTAIVVESLIKTAGYKDDPARQAAVAKAVTFICETRNHPDMSEADYDAGYDVRGWGYIYGLKILALLKRDNLIPAGQAEACDAAAKWYLDALQKTEIPEVGGWNYARPPGRKNPASPSSFMTPAGLEALFEARAAGYTVDPAIVSRALDAIERSRGPAGNVTYSIAAKPATGTSNGDRTPGAIGRMCSVESVLVLGGRGSIDRVRSAVDAFIVHWKWLDQRRAKTGTHVGPYAVAPYYFMFAHHYAARAVELLPQNERAEYRARINELLLSVRDPAGSWNDRVFKRSSAYGTAMALLAIGMPEATPQAKWPNDQIAK